ncbi:ABC transporter ATP-binding protein [Stutzerimonas kirkiae]|uniref:ABC transporter n=1 Tax=Stutzerimonas kirkiae TaxID=2211392 RepID=A0A4Q9R9J3_9GAMM|nr:ABC transporter ATP-binding protein [Stutzerimonas kirkiae]TBU97349.1 ABC transporter [Stutzerimonas kirkiae]TBU98223.1 ABC transporter [Stutzerimonas kirkiae]TBV06623.1 ABC transporter [Stutzerimonas kirkiae]TBV13081.1 ABC transporter [Stutzerimonas kirkiae]
MNAAAAMQQERPSIVFDRVGQVFTSSDGSEVVALENTSFEIQRHEFIAVIGPSGCGKSTLLRILAGLVRPTHGQVEIYGLPVTEPREEIGIVFQKPTLLPWLSIRDNLTFPMRHKYGRVSPQEVERGEELLEMVGLGNFAGKRPDELSGGMQQRAAIARALLHDPEILLMDEPFSALDALTRDELSLELLNIWTQRPKTVFFITHSIPEALLLADRILVMSARPGRVREIIDVDLPRPRSLETLTEPRFNELANHIRRQVFSRHVGL